MTIEDKLKKGMHSILDMAIDPITTGAEMTAVPLKDTQLRRLGVAALSTGLHLIPSLISKKPNRYHQALMGALGAISGYMAIPIGNEIYENIQEGGDYHTRNKEVMKKYFTPTRFLIDEPITLREITETEKELLGEESLEKKSGVIFRAAAKASVATPKLLWKGTKLVGKGLAPTRAGAPLGEKIFGLGVKGAAGYGIFKGTTTLAKKPVQSGADYTTLLRNNILAGTIKPSELSRDELVGVRKLGFK